MKKIKEIENRIANIEEKGYTKGLVIEDYNKIKVILRDIKRNGNNTTEWNALTERLNNIVNELYKAGLLNNFSLDNAKYILNNAYIVPLILANNSEYKIKGSMRYKVTCPFHEEENHYLMVNDLLNSGYCYQCNKTYGSIKYLEEVEHLKYKDIMQLLAGVYLFKIKGENKKFEKLIKKYQEKIIDGEYKDLLDRSSSILTSRNIEEYHGINVAEEINKRYETIERIKNHVYDPNFLYKEEEKIVKLKRQ